MIGSVSRLLRSPLSVLFQGTCQAASQHCDILSHVRNLTSDRGAVAGEGAELQSSFDSAARELADAQAVAQDAATASTTADTAALAAGAAEAATQPLNYGTGPVGVVAEIMLWTHDTLGLPWFATLGMISIAAQICLLPFSGFIFYKHLQHNAHDAQAEATAAQRYKDLQSKLAKVKTAAERERLKADYEAAQQKAYYLALVQPRRSSAGKTSEHANYLTFMTGAVSVVQMFAVDNLVKAKVPSLSAEGFLWCSSLASPDPYLLLPLFWSVNSAVFGADSIFKLWALVRDPSRCFSDLMHQLQANQIQWKKWPFLLVPLAAQLPSVYPLMANLTLLSTQMHMQLLRDKDLMRVVLQYAESIKPAHDSGGVSSHSHGGSSKAAAKPNVLKRRPTRRKK